ncbi:methyltransferase, FxLD system [Dactylosporangium sp. NPDC005572]|uniref:methyltransferase, FxLD system n=1 Tax=Dactylosporangium sp. NPDC005572 TaxID=3156889 RepID=UPI0033B70BE8
MPEPSTGGWRQLNLTFDSWQAAERAAAEHLGPLLISADDDGILSNWWHIRKGPTWRFRLQAGHDADPDQRIEQLLKELTAAAASGGLRDWAEPIYEPETNRFGGGPAMAIAHALFHADSRYLLQHLTTGIDQRRESGLILAARLLTGARQDWYEQGDVWERVAAHRITAAAPPDLTPADLAAVRRLLLATADTDASPLHAAPDWPAAFERAGAGLGDLAARGQLTRGLRAVLADHILFLCNRHGIAAADQHTFAVAASRVVFQHEPPADEPTPAQPGTTVAPATTDTTTDDQELRDALADHIRDRGTFRTPAVERAFRTVPRHLFLPGVPLQTAYGTQPVVTKRDSDGASISSASKPNLVAAMLEQLEAQPGQRVLEIGAATGINAALLAELVGPVGTVVTIELDDDLAAGARAALDRAGYPHVTVICGDGTLGHPAGAPYERIIVTAEAFDITEAWWDQIAPGGRLVAPVRLHGSGLTRSLGFALGGDGHLTSTDAEVCGFVPMRGATTTQDRYLQLTDGVVLRYDIADQPSDAALARALEHPAHHDRTGIYIDDHDPAQHLDLWLLTHTDQPFGRLSVTADARRLGLADPARRWAGASLYHGGSIAYLTAHPVTDTRDELGVTAHGPDARTVTDVLTGLLRQWAQGRPAQPTVTARRTTPTTPTDRGPGRFARTHTQFSITW